MEQNFLFRVSSTYLLTYLRGEGKLTQCDVEQSVFD